MNQPLFMKTYGKYSRKITAWISPDNRKQAFESSHSSSLDSANEASKPSKPAGIRTERSSATSRGGMRLSKRKAMQCLKEMDSDEENIYAPSSPEASPELAEQNSKHTRTERSSATSRGGMRLSKRKAVQCLKEMDSNEENIYAPSSPEASPELAEQNSKHTRTERSSATSRGGMRLSKRKAVQCLKEMDSDEENIYAPSSPEASPELAEQNSKHTRKAKLVPRLRGSLRHRVLPVLDTRESDGDLISAPKRHKVAAQRKKKSNGSIPSTDRFVTRRRGSKFNPSLKPSNTSIAVLNSSNEFVPGRQASNKQRILRTFQKRRVLAALQFSSAENSIDVGSFSSAADRCKQEVSLVEVAERSLGPCARKPLFCSTPSASLDNRPHPQASPSVFLSSASLPGSVSHVSIFSTSQEDLSRCVTSARSLEDRPSIDQTLSTDSDSENWAAELTATLKAKCLLQKCTVYLERDALTELTATWQPTEFTQRTQSSSGNNCGDIMQNTNGSESHTANKTKPSEQKLSKSGSKTEDDCVELVDNCQAAVLSRGAPQLDIMLVQKWTPVTPIETLQLKSLVDVSDSAIMSQCVGETCTGSDPTPESHLSHHMPLRNETKKMSSSANLRDRVSSDDQDTATNPLNIPAKRKKGSIAPKKRRGKSMSKDRSGTARKVCVSGLSVSRWKDRSNNSIHFLHSKTAAQRGSRARDVMETTQPQPFQGLTESLLHGASILFSPAARTSCLNLSSLLVNQPDTHTWSRLKAALSVHRKTKVFATPKCLPPSTSPIKFGLSDLSQDLFATPKRTPHCESFRSKLLHGTPLSMLEDGDLSDAEKVYAECGQQGPLAWEECFLPHRLKRCVKIGEGTFGEVFSTTNASEETVALKIIPVEGKEKVNGEDQKTFGEILHEIIISKELSSLKDKQHNQTNGFIGLYDLHCVQGCYPAVMLNAWDAFDQQKSSENDRPDFFDKQQLFLILEFEFGGSDLENSNGMLPSLVVAKSILHQVTAALAVAEQELRFEHRDLHWGNVLVKTTKTKKGTFVLNGSKHSLDTKGVLVRIIDYSLSRLEIDGLTVSCDISEDEELFMGQGDYQFDIYRVMRQENGNNWSDYQPHSNILWLHYLSSKLRSMKYRGTGGRTAKDTREELTHFQDNLLQYRSATEALQKCPFFQKKI